MKVLSLFGKSPTPAWVASDFLGRQAVMDADYTNNKYYWNGVSYANETLLNTAIGITKSGVTRTTTTPYIFGPNVVTNGTFNTDISGWNTDFSTIAWNAAHGGCLDLSTTSGSGIRAFQLIPTNQSAAYAFTGNGATVIGGSVAQLRASVNNNLSPPAGVSAGSFSFATNQIGYFAAESSSIYLGLYGAQGGGAGEYQFKNITANECVPFLGMLRGQVGVKINFTPPATVGSTMVLWQSGGNERGRVRLELRTDYHLHMIVTWQNGSDSINPATDIDLGLLTALTPAVIEAQFGVDMASASLNGGTRIYSPVIIIPGMAQMWVGRSFTGETWTGTIERISVFSRAHSAASYLVVYGDSIPAYPNWVTDIAAACVPPRRAVIKSYAGFGIASIKDKFLTTDPVQNAGGWLDPKTIYILEGGYNDQSNCTTAVPANRPLMISALTTANPSTRYLIYNIQNGESAAMYSGGAVYNQMVLQNSNDLTTYGDAVTTVGGKMVKIREALVAAHDGTAQDLIDFGHDIEPTSCRINGDMIHPNFPKGSGVYSTIGVAAIQNQGWSPVAPT